MSLATYADPVWAGRLVDQEGERDWDASEPNTGLAKLTATLMCRTSEAPDLRPAMGDPHPNFPLMWCDERSVRERNGNSGLTRFVADYYGVRDTADETRVFQPRIRALLFRQTLTLKIVHAHLGPVFTAPWILKLRLPRPQEMGEELVQFVGNNPLAQEQLDIFEPRLFVIKQRRIVEFGAFSVITDALVTFQTSVQTSLLEAQSQLTSTRGIILQDDGELIDQLDMTETANCKMLDTFQHRIERTARMAGYTQGDDTLQFRSQTA